MRRLLIASAAILTLAIPHAARPDIPVVCVNCSDFTTQLMQYGKEAASLESQLQAHVTQLQQYANMIQNTIALPEQMWASAQGDIMQVRNIANAAALLSGGSGSMISRLQSAGGYANQAINTPQQMAGQLDQWQQTLGNNLNSFGRTIGLQQNQQANDAALIAALQVHAATATGQMQALQAGNELAGQTSLQLLKIQSTLSAAAQMQATQFAVSNDRRALEDAALQRFLNVPAPNLNGWQRY